MDCLSSNPKINALQLHQRLSLSYISLLLLSLSSIYYLTSNSIDFIWVFAFFAALVITFTFALPHLPNLRIFLTQNQLYSYPIQVSKSNPDSKIASCVVWSIGSNPKWEGNGNSGCWVEVFSNGDVYEGEFHEGKCSGSGVYHYYMCGKYEGDWIGGKYAGFGVETWGKGSKYRGQYRNGLRHGIGMYKFYTGDVYEGEWSNGQSHGFGVYSSMDGSKYVGEFKWGVKHGFGHFHYRNGDVYAGEYFADRMHGFGVYKFVNGHQYEGSWHEGRRQGLGLYTFRNGETHSGYWQNGLLNKAGNQLVLPGSKVSDVVQEAKTASERACSLTRVDKQVNKVVAAANRAANAARVVAVKAVQKRMHEGINKASDRMSD